MIKTDGIIFDMDGTIWDTCKEVTDSWNIIAKKYRDDIHFTVPLIKSCMGLLMEDFAAKAMPQVEDAQLRLKILKECVVFENGYIEENGAMLYPTVIETIRSLSGKCPLFIVSNCQAGYIETFFKAFDTEKYFKDYENPGRSGLAKAENIKLICQRNGIKYPVYVGDTQGDADACKMAGVPFIFAAYGFEDADPKDCAEKIECFEDLEKVVSFE